MFEGDPMKKRNRRRTKKGNMQKLFVWYQDYRSWELRMFPKTTRWWRGLVPAVRWAIRIIVILALVEAIRL
jgi:hypothetical protein